MKRSLFTEEQIAFALKQQDVSTPVEKICRKMAISDATFYNWKKKYSGLGPLELRRVKQLERRTRSSSALWPICRSIKPCLDVLKRKP